MEKGMMTMMDEKEFRKDFMENVKAEAAATGEGTCAAFVNMLSQHLIEAEILTDFTHSFYKGIGKKNKRFRVDGYAFDEFDETMVLIIADYEGTDDERIITKSATGQIQERLHYFVDQALNGTLHRDIEMSTPCADLVDLLRSQKEKIRRYQLLIFTDAQMSAKIKTLDTNSINGTPAETQVWDIARLYKIYSSGAGRQTIEINFKEHLEYGIPCLEASNATSNEFTSYLCIVSGQVLADIYDAYGSSLLEGNVRSFLSTKVAVNKKIRETILNWPERFFAYNNGISATAMDIEFESSEHGKFITKVSDFQIINGGQTTASLSNARFRDKADLTKTYIQMKLTVFEDNIKDNATELVQNISRSSNSQNKVSDADFFSTHPFHVRMEQFSRKLYAKAGVGAQYETNWFYERARGQYLQAQMRMTPAKKKQFALRNPKKQVITKTDLAKARNAWAGLPQIVSKGAQANFQRFAEIIGEAWDKSELEFNEKYFQESAALVLLFRHTELVIPKQSWYEQGYRANIVVYTIAMLRVLIMKQYPEMQLDLMGIWNRQEVLESVTSTIEAIAEQVYKQLTSAIRPVVNVTQWCKRDDCWRLVQNINVSLTHSIESALISKDEDSRFAKDAKADQRVVSETEAQAQVISYSPENWSGLLEFVVKNKLVSPEELTALRIACQIPNKLPTPAQSKKALTVLERAELEGFKLLMQDTNAI